MSVEHEELRANLQEYHEQLQQLEELLLDEPDNAEYQALYSDVQEAIALTEAALSEARSGEGAGPSDEAAGLAGRKRKSRFETSDASAGGALPMQVLDQIKTAKSRSALEGGAPMGWAIGFPCLARSGGGHWQPATVVAVTADAHFQVEWQEGGERAVVPKVDCRPRDTGNYHGVNAPTRKAVSAVSADAYDRYLKGETSAVPSWMQIKEGDSEKAKEKKRRALKALKKKKRFEEKDLQSTKQANEWKSFLGGKGGKKKAGFMTKAKESMFAVPDSVSGKVGVVGSGQGMTNAPTKRTRIDF